MADANPAAAPAQHAGDTLRETLAGLYAEYGHRVYSFMRYRLPNNDDALELTQSVFLRAVERYAGYNPAKGAPAVWLFTIARHMLYGHYRAHGRRQAVALDALDAEPDRAPLPEDSLQSDETRQALRRALAALPRRENAVVTLKYAGGLRNTEISRVMDLSEKNVGVILHRSLKKLRQHLEKELEDG